MYRYGCHVTNGCSHSRGLAAKVALVGVIGMLAVTSFCPRALAEGAYLQADAVITGREMHTFVADGETVNVVLGKFSLAVGGRSIVGRDAVIWIKESRLGNQTLRTIELYVEGDAGRAAKIVEPDKTTTTDNIFYVVLRQQGGFRARVGARGLRKMDSLPIYRRALAARKKRLTAKKGEPPTVVVVLAEGAGEVFPTKTTDADDKPGQGPEDGDETKKTIPAETPAMRSYSAITYTAESTSMQDIIDHRYPDDPGKSIRVVICKGNVYIAQSQSKSESAMSMQADAAVIYIGDRVNIEGKTVQGVIGAYLEGHVVIRRGVRTIRGRQLFYSFIDGRALILQPVLRTVQEGRNIPIYIRAREGRQTAAWADPKNEGLPVRGRRWEFRNAMVTTSDFRTPEYHIGARKVTFEDTAMYEEAETGERISPQAWRTKMTSATVNLRSIPLLWMPYVRGSGQQGHTALRKAQFGSHGRFGWGAETQWHLFRLLGVTKPAGFKGRLDFDWYERGYLGGVRVNYDKLNYSGYFRAYGLIDSEGEDDFGTDRENIAAPTQRGRLLWRHKQFLPRDWQFQFEGSYLCDANFLEEFFPSEFWTGKDQENLLYAKKQRDNWAMTVLTKWRINDFLTQTEAFPEVAGYLIGQSLWRDRLTLHSEARLGAVRYRPADSSPARSSPTVARADIREELNVPLAIGPVKLLPFVAARGTYWSESPRDGALVRPWGQIGVNATTHIWRVYNNVESRLLDIHRLRHVITPYARVFGSGTSAQPDRLYPFNEGIEEHVRRLDGGTVGVRQLWQTKRGPADDRHTVDWLRLNISGSVFNNGETDLPADGRYFFHRPEHSMARNAINAEAAWHASDSTTVLADANYDTDSGELGRGNIGVAISRDPRLRYYLGLRTISAVDSAMGTFGLNYKISRKYSLNFFEQYDFDFDGGQNEATSLSLVRKFPRLYAAFTFVYDRTQNDVGLVISIWPEGVEEVRIGGSKLSLLKGGGDDD